MTHLFILFLFCIHSLFCEEKEDLTFLQTYQALAEGEVTPKATPIVSCGYDVSILGSYLLWTPFIRGLAIAEGSVPLPGSASRSDEQLPQGIKYRPDFNLSSGFKVGARIDFDFDGWGSDFVYTWFSSQASCSFCPSQVAANLTLWEGNFNVVSYGQFDSLALFPNITNEGSSHWKLHCNVFDWLLHRNFFLSRSLVVDLFFGFKGAYLKQYYDINYHQKGISTTLIQPPATQVIIGIASEDYKIDNQLKYGAAGPKMGFNGVWQISKCFGAFCDLGLSSLYGKFHITRQDFSEVYDVKGLQVGITNYNALNLVDSFWQLNSVLENSIGIKWDYWFSKERYCLAVKAGWETQIWFDQNQFLQPGLYGNLTFQGLNASLSLTF